jgi:hypothetical protein
LGWCWFCWWCWWSRRCTTVTTVATVAICFVGQSEQRVELVAAVHAADAVL